MSNLDPQATPFVPAYTRMFYTGPIMPPHAVHGAPPPNAAYQSPGADMKRTPLNPQAPAFVPGAGIGFRPGSTATFAHGRVQLPSHAFPPQQQVAKSPVTPPTALAYAEAAPAPEVREVSPATKETSVTATRPESWAAKVKKAVAADTTQTSSPAADGATAAAGSTESNTVLSPKQPSKAKAAPKAARSKAGVKARASKAGATADAAKPTPKASTKSTTPKVSAKVSRPNEKGATSQRDQSASSPSVADKVILIPSPTAKVNKQESLGAEDKKCVKSERSTAPTRTEVPAGKSGTKAPDKSATNVDQTSEKSSAKLLDKVVSKTLDKSKSGSSEPPNDDSNSKVPEKTCEKVADKIVSRVVEKGGRLGSARGAATNDGQSPTIASKMSQGEVLSAEGETTKVSRPVIQSQDSPETQDATKASSKGERAMAEAHSADGEVEERAPESAKVKQAAVSSEPPEVKNEEGSSGIAEKQSIPPSAKREGLQSARPSASSRVSALLGNTDDDDVTRYQPLSSRAPFGLKTGSSYGLKQKLQIVVAGLGTFGSGGLDKLDAETKKDVSSSTTGLFGGDRSGSPRGVDQSTGSIPITGANEGHSTSNAATSVPTFTYTLSANNVKVYNLQDMLSIRHLPQCNKPQKPSSPSALFGMRNTVMGSSSGIFDIPSALGHKHRGLDRMLEEGSNSNWNLRASKDEAFRTNTHGSASGLSDMSWIRRPATEVPEVPKDSWQATQAAAKVKSDRNVKLQRKLKAQLNKMTPATYDDIFKAIMDLGIETIEEAQLCVNLVFEKAITNHQYIDMYAKLCYDLQTRLESDGVFKPGSGNDFRRMLVHCCQTAFENNLQKPFVPPEGAEEEETFEALLLYKKKMKGNLVFVSALSMQHLVGARVLLAILTKLIDNKDSVQLEALAAFLPTVANSLEASKLKDSFEDMFTKIRALSQDPEVEHRIRCLLLDCVEQRDKELRRNEHQQFRKVQSHVGGSGFQSVLPKTRTYQ